MDRSYNELLNIKDGSNAARIGLLVVSHAGGTVGMVNSIIMVMECDRQGGKEKKADKIE